MRFPAGPRRVLTAVLAVAGALAARAEEERKLLLAEFGPAWREVWVERKLADRGTAWAVVEALDAGGPALAGRAEDGNSALQHPLPMKRPAVLRLRWKWRLERPLGAAAGERTRSGDDFAARVFVVFEKAVLPWRTRAVNYVWSAEQEAGATYPNPYSGTVAMIVVRGPGDSAGGEWRTEERDVLADYEAFFGEPAGRVEGVAVMVDTDNTGGRAEAWFRDLEVTWQEVQR